MLLKVTTEKGVKLVSVSAVEYIDSDGVHAKLGGKYKTLEGKVEAVDPSFLGEELRKLEG